MEKECGQTGFINNFLIEEITLYGVKNRWIYCFFEWKEDILFWIYFFAEKFRLYRSSE